MRADNQAALQEWLTAIHHTQVFGVPLSGIAVPLVVTACLDYIERVALFTDCVYAVDTVAAGAGAWASANAIVVKELRSEFNQDDTTVNLNRSGCTCYEVASILILFLRELPAPLIPLVLGKEFLRAATIVSHSDMMAAMRAAMAQLPQINAVILKRLCIHLFLVSSYHETNNSPVAILSSIFAPLLFAQRTELSDSATSVNESICLQALIKDHVVLFDLGAQSSRDLNVAFALRRLEVI